MIRKKAMEDEIDEFEALEKEMGRRQARIQPQEAWAALDGGWQCQKEGKGQSLFFDDVLVVSDVSSSLPMTYVMCGRFSRH